VTSFQSRTQFLIVLIISGISFRHDHQRHLPHPPHTHSMESRSYCRLPPGTTNR